jgi:intracellular multiplication protein IcmL
MSKPMGNALFFLDVSVLAAVSLLAFGLFFYAKSGTYVSNILDVSGTVKTMIVKDDYYVSEKTGPVLVNVKDPIQATIPLSLPVKSINDIVAWTTMVAVQLFTIDFFQVDAQLNQMKPYFTNDGWEALQAALKGSGWMASVVGKKLSVTSVLNGAPTILKHGVLNGAYSWVINFPLLVSYEGASESRVERRVFTLTVRRISADFSSGQAGIAIDSFVTTTGSL